MMRKIVVVFSILATLLTLNSCSEDSKEYVLVDSVDEYNKQVALKKYNVTFLFEVEDIKIYRFEDNGKCRYFSIGNGAVFSTESHFKSTTKTHEEVDTSVIQPAIGGTIN